MRKRNIHAVNLDASGHRNHASRYYAFSASENYSLNIGLHTTQFLDHFGEQFCPRVAIRSRWISNRIPIESHAFKSNLLAVKSYRLNRFDRDLNGIAIRTVNHHPMA